MFGLLFEEWAHAKLSQGIGNYDLTPLNQEAAAVSIRLPSSPPLGIRIFEDVELPSLIAANKAGSQEKYYLRPANKRYPAVDSILLPNTCFQMTVSRHKPPPDVACLIAKLEVGGPVGPINMVYVVPAANFASFTAGARWVVGMKQWVLGLPEL
jgi:hypothetical protein